MIGNETDTDIIGAKSVGWCTVLVCHTEENSRGIADYDIPSLAELRPILFPHQVGH